MRNWGVNIAYCVSQGFFEGAMVGRGSSTVAAAALAAVAEDGAVDGWGADAELLLDGDSGDEKETAKGAGEAQGEAVGGGGWDEGDDDLELPPELEINLPSNEEENYFVAPTKGTSPAQLWANNSQLLVDHVYAGSFDSAFRLLHDQVRLLAFFTVQIKAVSLANLGTFKFSKFLLLILMLVNIEDLSHGQLISKSLPALSS